MEVSEEFLNGFARNTYELSDFLRYDGKLFIDNAYRLILKREPDLQAYQFYLQKLLEAEMTKIGILYDLRHSDEGKSHGATITQLIAGYRLCKILNVRWLRPLLRLLADLGCCRGIFAEERNLQAIKSKMIASAGSAETMSAEQTKLLDLLAAQDKILVNLQGQLRDCQKRLNQLQAQVSSLSAKHNGHQPPELPPKEATEYGFDYLEFEDRLRGSEKQVKEHHQRYVHEFKGQSIVLDIGCGRGEFLELLEEAEVAAIGVDLDPRMVRHCRNKGLQVTGSDALSYLRSLPDNHLGGIFCAQMIEHLTTDDTFVLIKTAYQKLRTNGVFIVETLNPESLLVQYRWFWLDPTHVRLVHPEMLKFIFESAGFKEVSYQVLPPTEGPILIPPLSIECNSQANLTRFNEATKYLNEILYAGFDYTLRGIKG